MAQSTGVSFIPYYDEGTAFVKRSISHRPAVRALRVAAVAAIAVVVLLAGVAAAGPAAYHAVAGPEASVRCGRTFVPVVPGITVLLEDSVRLIRGKRVGLLTNQTGVDRSGTSDIALLTRSPLAQRAAVRVAVLFSPEHGIRGQDDREFVPGGTDSATRIPVYSLYGATVLAPPDSILRRLDVLVIDLQDVGARTWTYVASVVYAMRAAARNHVPVLVLDRPNPITGTRTEGPMLDTGLANPDESTPGHPARPYALAPIPLRHGLTMGELARYYNEDLHVGADLHVIPARGWRRGEWFDETGLPWIRPSPNLPSLTSALLYPALVAFEGSNLSVGRGTPDAFQRLGSPWLDAQRVAALLSSRRLGGVRFDTETFTPVAPGDGKFGGRAIPGVRIVVTDRSRVETGRLGAALLWAVAQANGDSLRLDTAAFDLRFGDPAARNALVHGADPDGTMDAARPAVAAFMHRVAPFLLYR
jgi:uncharacterized protein YbbC (DUF1343 family)